MRTLPCSVCHKQVDLYALRTDTARNGDVVRVCPDCIRERPGYWARLRQSKAAH